MSTVSRRATFGKENVKNGDGIRRAKAAPDFSKLHKQWDEKLQKGKAVKKKPLTSVQPFQLSQIPNRAVQNADINFKVDPKSKESILNGKGISENTGRATFSASGRAGIRSGIPRLSVKPPRLTDISQGSASAATKITVSAAAVTKEEPAAKPEVVRKPSTKEQILPLRSPHVKKTHPKQDFKVEFECDEDALDSIINGEGISVLSTTPSRVSGKIGPVRKSYTKARAAPFPQASSRSRFSEKGAVTQEHQEEANAAKKRWSIYNRGSFSTKVDLMTWLKQLAGEPDTKFDTIQSKRNSFSVTSVPKTSTHSVRNVSSATRDSMNFSSSVPNVVNSPAMLYSILKPNRNFSHSDKQQDSTLNTQNESFVKIGGQTSHDMVLEEKPNPYKFNKSCVGFQGFDDDARDESIVSKGSDRDNRCPTYLTPEKGVCPKKGKSPGTKSILKKEALCSIKEFSSESNGIEEKMQAVGGAKVKTPRNGVEEVPSRCLSSIKETSSAEVKVANDTVTSNAKQRHATPSRSTKNTPVRNRMMPVRSARKKTPAKESLRPGPRVEESDISVGDPSGSTQNNMRVELSAAAHLSACNGQIFNCPEVETCEADVDEVIATVSYSPQTSPIITESPENTNKKTVRWNNELTYLSPALLEEESDASRSKQSCVVKLFAEEPVSNQSVSSDIGNAASPLCDVLHNTDDNVSSSFSFISSSLVPITGQLTDTIPIPRSVPVSPTLVPMSFNNILLGKGTTPDGVLPTKSAISHQIKYVIPAEQPLEKSGVYREEKGTVNTTSSLSVGNVSLPSTLFATSQTGHEIFGKGQLVNHTDITGRYGNPNDIGKPKIKSLPSVIGALSTSQAEGLFKKDKTKKKKRISILEKIYGDAILFVDDTVVDSSQSQGSKNDFSKVSISQDLADCDTTEAVNEETSAAVDEKPNEAINDKSMLSSHSVEVLNKTVVSSNYRPAINVFNDHTFQSVQQTTTCGMKHYTVHSTDANQPSVQQTLRRLSPEPITGNSANQTSVQLSLSQPIHTPQNGNFPHSNTSTFVTYSSNTKNILYGDFNATPMSKTTSLPRTISPETFFNNKKSPYVELASSPFVDNNSSKTSEFIGGVTILTPGKKERADYNAFIVSPRVGKSPNAMKECLTPVNKTPISLLPGNENVVNPAQGVVVISPPKKSEIFKRVHSTPQPCSRSDKLGKYVTSLLNISENSIGIRSTPLIKKHALSERKPRKKISDAIPVVTSCYSARGHVPTAPPLDETEDSDETDSLLNESEICMVFSTPFKEGLRNHILLTNSFPDNSICQNVPSDTSNLISFTPSRNVAPFINSDSSAFRRVPSMCNIQPKSPIDLTDKSDEMQALFGMSKCVSPGRYMRVEDAEIALYHQLGEISTRLHEEVNVLRKGVKNPLSIILTSGDEMHFVPIDVEPMEEADLNDSI